MFGGGRSRKEWKLAICCRNYMELKTANSAQTCSLQLSNEMRIQCPVYRPVRLHCRQAHEGLWSEGESAVHGGGGGGCFALD